jgi:hypothetical protein
MGGSARELADDRGDEAVGRARGGTEVQRRLGELKLDHDRLT